MPASEAQIRANRLNSKRSTGPKTAAGKERSRANALKHGLCSVVVVVEDEALVANRAAEWTATLKPESSLQLWLVHQITTLSLGIERCGRIARQVRDKVAFRAEVCWDDDRRVEAVKLGSTLGKAPELVGEQLRATPQGCEWLMTRWAMLAHLADLHKAWTADQTRLAFDLLGTPSELREGQAPGTLLDFEGRVVAQSSDPASIARREIAALKQRREEASELDEINQSLAAAGHNDDHDAELKRLLRYETTLQNRLRWCFAQLQLGKSPITPAPAPAKPTKPIPPRPARPVQATPTELPPWNDASFDLEYGEMNDLLATLPPHLKVQLEKSQEHLRKLEAVRA